MPPTPLTLLAAPGPAPQGAGGESGGGDACIIPSAALFFASERLLICYFVDAEAERIVYDVVPLLAASEPVNVVSEVFDGNALIANVPCRIL